MNKRQLTNRINAMLLAALVALCPIKCLMAGCYSCNLSSTDLAVHGCSCCFDDPCDSPAAREKGDSDPDQPGDCSCNNCFCAGALTVSDASIDLPVFESILSFELICWSDADELVPLFPQIPPTGFFLHRLSGSAEMRAALSCWIL